MAPIDRTDQTAEPEGYLLEDILRQDVARENASHFSPTPNEGRLLAAVYDSLTNSVRDEVHFHLRETFPTLYIAEERGWALIDLVQQTLRAQAALLRGVD